MELSYREVANALRKINPVYEIEILEEVMVAEANVFLCRYKDKRFNVYFDIVYGPEIKAVSSIRVEELKMIEELMVAEVGLN